MAQGCVRLRLCFIDAGDKHSAIFHDSLSATSTLEELENRVVCKSSSFAVSLPLTFLDPRKAPGSNHVVLSDVQDLRKAYQALKSSSSTCSSSSCSIIPLQRITVHVPVSVVTSTSSAPLKASPSAPTCKPVSTRGASQSAAATTCSDTSAASVSNQETQRLINNILLAVRQHDFTASARARTDELRGKSEAVLQRPARLSVKRTSSLMSTLQQDAGDDAEEIPQQPCRRHLAAGAVSPALCSSLA